MVKSNKGAPGIDGVTFEAIEESGVESFLKQIQDELVHNTYRPMPVRKKEIPKDGGHQGPGQRAGTISGTSDASKTQLGLTGS